MANGESTGVAIARLQEQVLSMERALQLQAKEYEWRLADLNHAHEEAIEVAGKTVTSERFEQYIESEREKREAALARIDEKLEEYIKRYEQRQREVDQAMTIQKTAADAAKQFATAAANKAQQAVTNAAQRANIRIAAVGVFIAIVVVIVNILTGK